MAKNRGKVVIFSNGSEMFIFMETSSICATVTPNTI